MAATALVLRREIGGAVLVRHGLESGQHRRETEALPTNAHAGTATTNVEMTCLQGLADLARLEGPWLDGLATGDSEVAATMLRLLLAHLTWNSKRLLGAMV